jgi:hypothetical protein
MFERLYTADHPDIAQSLNSLDVSFARLMEKETAVELFHKALEMRQRLYGNNHPDVIETKNYLIKLIFGVL